MATLASEADSDAIPEVVDSLRSIRCKHQWCARSLDELFMAARKKKTSSMRKSQNLWDWFMGILSLRRDGLIKDDLAVLKDCHAIFVQCAVPLRI